MKGKWYCKQNSTKDKTICQRHLSKRKSMYLSRLLQPSTIVLMKISQSKTPGGEEGLSRIYRITVIQGKVSAKRPSRPSSKREPILKLLREHPEGLSTEQIRAYLSPEKPIGDTLQGLRRGNLVRTEGSGREMLYFLAVV